MAEVLTSVHFLGFMVILWLWVVGLVLCHVAWCVVECLGLAFPASVVYFCWWCTWLLLQRFWVLSLATWNLLIYARFPFFSLHFGVLFNFTFCFCFQLSFRAVDGFRLQYTYFVVQHFGVRLWFRVRDFQFFVVEGSSFVRLLCMCVFVSFLLFADFGLCMFVFFQHVLCSIFYY